MDALVLLIGSNNIPNFVTAKYLLTQERDDSQELPLPEKIFLLFSNDTRKFRNALVECLEVANEKIVDVPLGSDECNHKEIKKKLQEKLEMFQESLSSIHLNYTGGTKAMVLAASHAIESFCGNAKKKIFSYVDPQNHKLMTAEEGSFPRKQDLRSCIKMSIKELFTLHCLKLEEDKGKPKEEITSEYKNIVQGKDFFSKLASKEFQEKLKEFIKENNMREKRKKHKSKKNVFKDSHEREVLAIFLQTQGLIDESTSPDKDECEKLYKLISSEWLEEAVFSTLEKIRCENQEFGLTEVFWDINGNSCERNFQIDVMALRGYQMFIFSCTSESHLTLCKQKAFEVNYRAVQMGGEHAKSVLICLGDNNLNDQNPCPESLKADMAQFDAAQNFSVIGRASLSNKNELEKAIRNVLQDKG